MKSLKHLLAIAAVSVSTAASAALVSFDDLPVGSVITNQYAGLGVVFSGWENDAQVSLTTSNVYSPTYGNYLGNSADGTSFPSQRWDEVRLDFAALASNVSFKLYSHGDLAITFNAYDASDNLLETIVLSSEPWGNVVFGSSGIARISAFQPNDGWYWAMDEVSFDSSSVPEPASLALLGLGVIGLAFSRRKQA